MIKSILSLLLTIFSLAVTAQVAPSAEDISPLLIGEKFPEVMVTSIAGEKKTIISILEDQKSVVIFYRGGWCPYCNVHLAEIGELEDEIQKLGYQIIAISPDSPESLQAYVEKQDLTYSLYSDAVGDLIKAMGLAFKAPENYGAMLTKASGGGNKGFLPVSSLFVTDTSSAILFQYVSPDYKQRISGKMLMAVLESLQD